MGEEDAGSVASSAATLPPPEPLASPDYGARTFAAPDFIEERNDEVEKSSGGPSLLPPRVALREILMAAAAEGRTFGKRYAGNIVGGENLVANSLFKTGERHSPEVTKKNVAEAVVPPSSSRYFAMKCREDGERRPPVSLYSLAAKKDTRTRERYDVESSDKSGEALGELPLKSTGLSAEDAKSFPRPAADAADDLNKFSHPNAEASRPLSLSRAAALCPEGVGESFPSFPSERQTLPPLPPGTVSSSGPCGREGINAVADEMRAPPSERAVCAEGPPLRSLMEKPRSPARNLGTRLSVPNPQFHDFPLISCERVFTRKFDLAAHQRSHLPATNAAVLPLECEDCGHMFALRDSAQSHALSCPNITGVTARRLISSGSGLKRTLPDGKGRGVNITSHRSALSLAETPGVRPVLFPAQSSGESLGQANLHFSQDRPETPRALLSESLTGLSKEMATTAEGSFAESRKLFSSEYSSHDGRERYLILEEYKTDPPAKFAMRNTDKKSLSCDVETVAPSRSIKPADKSPDAGGDRQALPSKSSLSASNARSTKVYCKPQSQSPSNEKELLVKPATGKKSALAKAGKSITFDGFLSSGADTTAPSRPRRAIDPKNDPCESRRLLSPKCSPIKPVERNSPGPESAEEACKAQDLSLGESRKLSAATTEKNTRVCAVGGKRTGSDCPVDSDTETIAPSDIREEDAVSFPALPWKFGDYACESSDESFERPRLRKKSILPMKKSNRAAELETNRSVSEKDADVFNPQEPSNDATTSPFGSPAVPIPRSTTEATASSLSDKTIDQSSNPCESRRLLPPKNSQIEPAKRASSGPVSSEEACKPQGQNSSRFKTLSTEAPEKNAAVRVVSGKLTGVDCAVDSDTENIAPPGVREEAAVSFPVLPWKFGDYAVGSSGESFERPRPHKKSVLPKKKFKLAAESETNLSITRKNGNAFKTRKSTAPPSANSFANPDDSSRRPKRTLRSIVPEERGGQSKSLPVANCGPLGITSRENRKARPLSKAPSSRKRPARTLRLHIEVTDTPSGDKDAVAAVEEDAHLLKVPARKRRKVSSSPPKNKRGAAKVSLIVRLPLPRKVPKVVVWTEVENARLIEHHQQFGRKWKVCEKLFPNRTARQIATQFDLLNSKSLSSSCLARLKKGESDGGAIRAHSPAASRGSLRQKEVDTGGGSNFGTVLDVDSCDSSLQPRHPDPKGNESCPRSVVDSHLLTMESKESPQSQEFDIGGGTKLGSSLDADSYDSAEQSCCSEPESKRAADMISRLSNRSKKSKGVELHETRLENDELRWKLLYDCVERNKPSEALADTEISFYSPAVTDNFKNCGPAAKVLWKLKVALSMKSRISEPSLPADLTPEPLEELEPTLNLVLSFVNDFIGESEFLTSCTETDDCLRILVDEGVLPVLTEATKSGEHPRLVHLLGLAMESVLDVVMSPPTDVRWISLVAHRFFWPLTCWAKKEGNRKSFEIALYTVAVAALVHCETSMRDKHSISFTHRFELCMAICDVFPAAAQRLPPDTVRGLSSISPMFAMFGEV